MTAAISFIFFFIILRFSVTLFNYISDPQLRRVAKPYHELVSILIPVRNEEHCILGLLNSIRLQDYPNYEVLILDDSSTDNTFQICSVFTKKYPKFTIIRGAELPAGWLGKNYACYQLAKLAKGDFFLFLDADEAVFNGLINSAIHRMKANQLSLLSLFTNQVMNSTGEKIVVPLMHYVLLNLLPLKLVLLSGNASLAAASGQFMLFNRAGYLKNQWHLKVRDKVVEDIEIMKLIKQQKLRGETLLANGMINCRMYNNFVESVNGFSKNFLAGFNYSIMGLLVFVLLIIGGPMFVLMSGNFSLMFLMLGLIILSRVMISLMAGQNTLENVVLHPLQMLSLVLIAFLGIQRYLTKTNQWKGRQV